MTLPIVLRDEAQLEFDDAFDWYDNIRPGFGVRFLNEVERVFDRISKIPKLHQIVFADIRRAVVKKFPYSVYYRPHADRIEVIAVFHNKRDPRIWQGRASLDS